MLSVLAQLEEEHPFVWEGAVVIGASILVAILISVFGRRYVHRVRRRARDASEDQLEGKRRRRYATVVGLIVGTIQVVAWFTVVVIVLVYLNVPIGPLFASAGIIGVALGFGAQTVVKDTLAGLFMALEGQLDIGDVVDLQTEGGPVSGTVEAFTIRVTSIRQFDGTLSVVPNGSIQITQNKTRGWGRAIVDIRVALDEDPERVGRVLDELIDEIAEREPLQGWLRERPQVLGVTQLTDVAEVIRVVAETSPNHRIDTEREIRGRITQRIAEKGIRVPPVTAMPGSAG
ncbi:MAG TPA: mechanosensitive ion channel family protein [Actinomycetota bacterium]